MTDPEPGNSGPIRRWTAVRQGAVRREQEPASQRASARRRRGELRREFGARWSLELEPGGASRGSPTAQHSRGTRGAVGERPQAKGASKGRLEARCREVGLESRGPESGDPRPWRGRRGTRAGGVLADMGQIEQRGIHGSGDLSAQIEVRRPSSARGESRVRARARVWGPAGGRSGRRWRVARV